MTDTSPSISPPLTPHVRQTIVAPLFRWWMVSMIHMWVLYFYMQQENMLWWVFVLIVFSFYAWSVFIFLDWYNRYFQVYEGVIVVREGIFLVKKHVYSLENLQKVINRRTFVGRIFRYGTINLEVEPFSTAPIHLNISYIHNSARYVDLLRGQMFEYLATDHRSRVNKAS